MFCSNCGKQIPDNARFCDECGNAVNVASAQDSQSRQAPRQNAAYSGAVAYSQRAALPAAKLTAFSLPVKIAAIIVAAVIVVVGAAIAGGVLGGDIPNGEWKISGFEVNYFGRGSFVDFLGNKMSVYYLPGSFVVTGKYELKDGRIWMKPDEDDYSLFNRFFNSYDGYFVFNYSAGGEYIWLDGIRFERR
jgi:hypothetical protein